MPSPRLHRWTDFEAQDWACGVYDHGPMCGRCQRVDGPFADRLDAVFRGELEVRIRIDGAFVFSDGAVCPEGRA